MKALRAAAVLALVVRLVNAFILRRTKLPVCAVGVANEDLTLAPRRLSSFPPHNASQQTHEWDSIDFSSLSPDDPLFLDMPWPEEHGPAATAFANHMQWRRSLAEGERMRWQRWAVYKRGISKELFKYNVQDFVKQNLLRDLETRATQIAETSPDSFESLVYKTVADEMRSQDEAEVKAVMAAFYSAFNRRSVDDLRVLFLPDDEIEVVYPGYVKARGHGAGDKLVQTVLQQSRAMGTISPHVAGVRVVGNVAVVYTVESVGAGNALKHVRRSHGRPQVMIKPLGNAQRVLAVTVLRFANKQWRLMLHHCAPFKTSSFTGNAVAIKRPVWIANNSALLEKRDPVEVLNAEALVKSVRSFFNLLGVPTQAGLAEVKKGNSENAGTTPIIAPNPVARELVNPTGEVVDSSASVTKQTIQALRYLHQRGKLTKQQKDDLMADIVERIVHEQEALVETSFRVICADKLVAHSASSVPHATAIDDFADQCHVALQVLYAAKKKQRRSA